ncbi:MAG: transposase [Planctomycetes bacterium]|nr:transposase [Planctomycetota bacterium]
MQRFDSALRLNPHFHGVFVDGVFVVTSGPEPASFHPLPAPTDEELAGATARIVRRVLALLRDRGLLREDGDGLQLEDERSALDACQAAAVQGRIAFGEHAGRAVPRWRDPDAIRHGVEAFDQQARYRGFSLHAATTVEAGRSDALERLCRYVLRPAIDEERLAWTRDGKVVYRFKRPWKDGSQLVVFEPLVLIERLAALVPRPRRNLVTWHGAFAPGASHRNRVVPPPPEHDQSPPAFRSLQRRRPTHAKAEQKSKPRSRRRYTWWELLARSFGVDILVCPECQTRRRLLTWPQTVLLQPPAEADRLWMQRPASRVHHRPAHDRPGADLAGPPGPTPAARTTPGSAPPARPVGRLNTSMLTAATEVPLAPRPGSACHRAERPEVGARFECRVESSIGHRLRSGIDCDRRRCSERRSPVRGRGRASGRAGQRESSTIICPSAAPSSSLPRRTRWQQMSQ